MILIDLQIGLTQDPSLTSLHKPSTVRHMYKA